MTVDSQVEDAQALWNTLAEERAEPSEAKEFIEAESTETENPAEATTEADATEATQQAEDEKTDPFDALPPEVRARLAQLDTLAAQVAELPKLAQSVKTAEGRVAAMQRELDVARNAAKAVREAPTQAQISAASADTTKWAKLQDDFPEWAEATEQYVKAQLAGLTPQQAQAFDPAEVDARIEQRLEAERKSMAALVEEAKVEGKYPDWKDTVNGDEFKTWYAAQPADIQALANSPAGRDAIKLIDRFESAKAAPAEQVVAERKSKLAAAVTTKPGSPGARTTKSVDDMTPQELWDYEARKAQKRKTNGLTY